MAGPQPVRLACGLALLLLILPFCSAYSGKATAYSGEIVFA